ncbi:MAG TPA: response regulator, partial [Candidatus Synoicihabitans sp.]|nr:response regulator [Candidatus Synoicihabitans sp.]
NRTAPDLIMISLSLPDDAAFTLFRVIRTNVKTKYTPIFGLVVKTDSNAQQQAQQIGFTALATKPLDVPDLEAKVAKAMNLDTSQRYFAIDQEVFVMRLPEHTSQHVVNEVTTYLKGKVAEAVDSGISKAVFDLHELKRLDMTVIKLILHAMQTCRELALAYTLVGSGAIVSESKGFEDTRNWKFYDSFDEARSAFASAPLQPAASS